MGMALEAKRGGRAASPEVAKVAKGMTSTQLRDFAKTKSKGLPEHVKKKKKK